MPPFLALTFSYKTDSYGVLVINTYRMESLAAMWTLLRLYKVIMLVRDEVLQQYTMIVVVVMTTIIIILNSIIPRVLFSGGHTTHHLLSRKRTCIPTAVVVTAASSATRLPPLCTVVLDFSFRNHLHRHCYHGHHRQSGFIECIIINFDCSFVRKQRISAPRRTILLKTKRVPSRGQHICVLLLLFLLLLLHPATIISISLGAPRHQNVHSAFIKV
jgi:hypothetical protein